MNSLDYLVAPALVWLPERGVGYYPVTERPYDERYWERYRQLDDTPMGRALTQARVDFVVTCMGHLNIPRSMLDVGIGGGAFCEAAKCWGTDINPIAREWLRTKGKLWDGDCPVTTMCFWDSMEHIADLVPLLSKCIEWVFVSMPIYRDANHVIASKHFRKDEHCWYFTHRGLVWFMKQHGFTCVKRSTMETDLGREDIETFAFQADM